MIRQASVIALTLFVGIGTGWAKTPAITSQYTELSPRHCAVLPASGETGDVEDGLRCKGPAGYELLVLYGDARGSISVIAPDGKQHDLDYWTVITHHFSSVGEKAEWRLDVAGSSKTPIALIVRVNAYENPDRPEEVTSYLAVAKITKDSICVTDRIQATGTENVAARVAADSAADAVCLAEGPRE